MTQQATREQVLEQRLLSVRRDARKLRVLADEMRPLGRRGKWLDPVWWLFVYG